jgi:hypothetical protein
LNVSATIVDDHPALGAFPLEGYCGYSFYHLIGREIVTGEGYLLEYRKKRSQAIDLARFPHLESPIIRVWNMSSHAAYLAEAKCGKGVVLLTTLQFGDAVGAYPEANYLAQQLLAYLAQAEPEGRISPEALMGFAAPPGDAEHSDGAEG